MDNELVNELKQGYGFSGNVELTKIDLGYLSTNHIVIANNKKYFLKGYRERVDESGIEAIINARNYFFKNGIPVLKPVKTKFDKEYFVLHEHIFSLFDYIDLQVKDRSGLTKRDLKVLGEMLARIHKAGRDAPKSLVKLLEKKSDYWKTEKALQNISEIEEMINNKEKDEFDEKVLRLFEIKRKIYEEIKVELSEAFLKADHVIHGDYHEKNVYFNKGKIKYVFDWEKTAVRSRFHELIRSMDYMCLNNGLTKKDFENAKYYLNSYRNIYDFDVRDFNEALLHYYYLKTQGFWIVNEYYLMDNKKVGVFLDTHFEGVEYFYTKKHKIVEDFI